MKRRRAINVLSFTKTCHSSTSGFIFMQHPASKHNNAKEIDCFEDSSLIKFDFLISIFIYLG